MRLANRVLFCALAIFVLSVVAVAQTPEVGKRSQELVTVSRNGWARRRSNRVVYDL